MQKKNETTDEYRRRINNLLKAYESIIRYNKIEKDRDYNYLLGKIEILVGGNLDYDKRRDIEQKIRELDSYIRNFIMSKKRGR